jgi:hypothetical protein
MRLLIVLGIFAVALLVLTINPSGYSQLDDAGGELTGPSGLPLAGPATGQKLQSGKVPPVEVARAGKQPTVGLPPWFNALDTDRDGQVSLQEWREAGKRLEDFRLYDLDAAVRRPGEPTLSPHVGSFVR